MVLDGCDLRGHTRITKCSQLSVVLTGGTLRADACCVFHSAWIPQWNRRLPARKPPNRLEFRCLILRMNALPVGDRPMSASAAPFDIGGATSRTSRRRAWLFRRTRPGPARWRNSRRRNSRRRNSRLARWRHRRSHRSRPAKAHQVPGLDKSAGGLRAEDDPTPAEAD